jgi:hypothetical protein
MFDHAMFDRAIFDHAMFKCFMFECFVRHADVHHRFQCGIAPAAIGHGQGVRPAACPTVVLRIEGLTGRGSPIGL